jgi:hypothetical protein
MASRITPPLRDELRSLIVDGMTKRELAQHYKVGTSTVDTWKRDHKLLGLQLPGNRRCDMSDLQKLVDEGLTRAQLAAAYGCGLGLIDLRLKQAGIKARRANPTEKVERKTVVHVAPSARARFAANPFGL